MDELERLIAEKQETLDALKRQIGNLEIAREKLTVEIHAYQEAARLRPAFRRSPSPAARLIDAARSLQSDAPSRGKQPGAISHKWREFLGEWVEMGNHPYTYEDVYALASASGIDGQPHSVRDRIRKYKDLGFVTEIDGRFVVSEEAISRFSLTKREEPPSQETESGSTLESEGAATPELYSYQPTIPGEGER